MAEKLLKMLSEMNERYEIKMMVMNLISRLVGIHQVSGRNFFINVWWGFFPQNNPVVLYHNDRFVKVGGWKWKNVM